MPGIRYLVATTMLYQVPPLTCGTSTIYQQYDVDYNTGVLPFNYYIIVQASSYRSYTSLCSHPPGTLALDLPTVRTVIL